MKGSSLFQVVVNQVLNYVQNFVDQINKNQKSLNKMEAKQEDFLKNYNLIKERNSQLHQETIDLFLEIKGLGKERQGLEEEVGKLVETNPEQHLMYTQLKIKSLQDQINRSDQGSKDKVKVLQSKMILMKNKIADQMFFKKDLQNRIMGILGTDLLEVFNNLSGEGGGNEGRLGEVVLEDNLNVNSIEMQIIQINDEFLKRSRGVGPVSIESQQLIFDKLLYIYNDIYKQHRSNNNFIMGLLYIKVLFNYYGGMIQKQDIAKIRTKLSSLNFKILVIILIMKYKQILNKDYYVIEDRNTREFAVFLLDNLFDIDFFKQSNLILIFIELLLYFKIKEGGRAYQIFHYLNKQSMQNIEFWNVLYDQIVKDQQKKSLL